MLKVEIVDGIPLTYFACDYCGERMTGSDVYGWPEDETGQPVDRTVHLYHLACLRKGTESGRWAIAPVKILPIDLAGSVRNVSHEEQLADRLTRAILKKAIEAGEKGISSRDVQRAASIPADLAQRVLNSMVDWGILEVHETRPQSARPMRRYHAVEMAQAMYILTRL